MIKPTVGRVVWFNHMRADYDQPYCALITRVWSDTMVNLAVFDENGNTQKASSVFLYQEGGEAPTGQHAVWMPYQKGQAARTDHVTQELEDLAAKNAKYGIE